VADESHQAGQDEVEQLLQQAKDAAGQADATDSTQAAGGAAQASQQAAAGAEHVGQQEIETLLNEQQAATAATTSTVAKSTGPAASSGISRGLGSPSEETGVNPGDVELLLNQAEQALQSINEPVASSSAGISQYPLPDFSGAPPSDEAATLDLMQDVQLDVTIELGRTHMYLHDVLKLKKGAVVPLDKLAGDPVDIYVNGRLIARGEVLVLNDSFCVRVAELVVGESAVA
jgi:flagellar motor switch protein FliN/FliY